MAYTGPGSQLSDLINPEVLGQFIDVKLVDAIKFAPLCGINNDLQGRPGDTLTLPQYSYIGDSTDVAEGDDIPLTKLAATSAEVKVKKAGRGIEITDEAILSGYGDPVNEIAKQLLVSIASKVDNDVLALFKTAQTTAAVAGGFTKYAVVDMMAEFGEDMDGEMSLIINPAQLAILRKDPDFVEVMAGQKIISGEMGQIFGCRVVVSNKVADNEAFLVKPGAVNILLKRNVAVEADRDIIKKLNQFVVDEHYAVYIADESKIVRAAL
jgi:N4-gp56 family major capsid protein